MENKDLIINVGRQFGSGGRLVALEIGKRLGINVYDYELILKAAEQSGFSAELFSHRDEKKNLFSISSFFSDRSINCIDDNALFQIQAEVIKDIASKESAVIVGRCSDYVLRDRGCTLDVFISAPLEERIKRVMARSGLTHDRAEDEIRVSERKREAYYNYYTLGNWGVASNYDLCVDSSILGIKGTAEYIIDFARRSGKLK